MIDQIRYPRISFWDKEVEQINFINPEDFRREKLLRVLGLDKSELRESFGVIQREEIVRRQRLMRFFVENPRLIRFFDNLNFYDIPLPIDGQVFLDYFYPEKEHNPFWQLVNGLIKEVSRCSEVPPEVLSLTGFLNETKDELEAEERIMANGIAEKVQKAAYLEGVIEFLVDYWKDLIFREKGTEVYGYKKYSYGLSKRWKEHHPPNWTSKGLAKWTGIGLFVSACCEIHNWMISRLFYTPLVIETLPESIETEIETFIRNKLIGKLPGLYSEEKIAIQIFFRYSERGLEIRLLNVSVEKEEKKPMTIKFIKEDFRGYGSWKLWKIEKNNRKFTKETNYIRNQLRSTDFTEVIHQNIPDICDKWIKIDSNRVDQEFKWYAVSALYMTDFRKTYERLQDYRDYVSGQLKMLKAIKEIAKALVQRSERWQKPLCFPEVMEDDQHLVSFDTLEAIHLIGEEKIGVKKPLTAKELVSIRSLPSLNGQVIGFTGQNAGGKSATEEAIVNAIFLAQSGLPVFGKSFALNAKRKIGMVFLERGSGSTLELLLRKTKALLDSLRDANENGTVLILDEVGSGTQEIDGLEYGKKVLKRLSGSRYSIIFSTQITNLAKYAKDDLNAQCFSFDLNHQIEPGIGRGGIEKLIDRIGMAELLEIKDSKS